VDKPVERCLGKGFPRGNLLNLSAYQIIANSFNMLTGNRGRCRKTATDSPKGTHTGRFG
jgi:hypothetical protein